MGHDVLDVAYENETMLRRETVQAIQRKHARNTTNTTTLCIDCGNEIPEKRRNAIPGVLRCISCQLAYEAECL